MNLKKVKVAPKGVNKLLSIIDSLMKKPKVSDATDEQLVDRAVLIEEYANDLTKLVRDGKSTYQDIIQTIDETVSEEVRRKLESDISDVMDWPESLDETIWDYVQNTKDSEDDVEKVAAVIAGSNNLPDEDCVIIADEILSAYE